MYAGDYIEANSQGDKKDAYFYVAYNMHGAEHEFALPGLPGKAAWHVALDTGADEAGYFYPEGQELKLEGQRTVMVPEHTVMVLIGK